MVLYQSVLTRYDIDMYILIVFTRIEIKQDFCSFIGFGYCILTIDANMYFYWYFHYQLHCFIEIPFVLNCITCILINLM